MDDLIVRLESLGARVALGDRELLDLEFLAWQTEFWPLAARSVVARDLLGCAWSYYAEWLTWDGRMREADSYASRAIDLLQMQSKRTPEFIAGMRCAVQVCARVTAQRTTRHANATAMDWLRGWQPYAADSHWEADLNRHLAEHAWWAGQPQAADAFAERARRLAERLGSEVDVRRCNIGRSNLLLRLGQPEEALALLLLQSPDPVPYVRIQVLLQEAHARQVVGDPTAADCLTEAFRLIEQHRYPQFQALADNVARQF
jgi:hypothetical protein